MLRVIFLHPGISFPYYIGKVFIQGTQCYAHILIIQEPMTGYGKARIETFCEVIKDANADVADPEKPLSLRDLLAWGLTFQVGTALHLMHARRIWHGDLTPQNLLVSLDENFGEGAGVFFTIIDFTPSSDMATPGFSFDRRDFSPPQHDLAQLGLNILLALNLWDWDPSCGFLDQKKIVAGVRARDEFKTGRCSSGWRRVLTNLAVSLVKKEMSSRGLWGKLKELNQMERDPVPKSPLRELRQFRKKKLNSEGGARICERLLLSLCDLDEFERAEKALKSLLRDGLNERISLFLRAAISLWKAGRRSRGLSESLRDYRSYMNWLRRAQLDPIDYDELRQGYERRQLLGHLACALAASGRLRSAIYWFNLLIHFAPDHGRQVDMRIGWLRLLLGDPERATLHFRRFLDESGPSTDTDEVFRRTADAYRESLPACKDMTILGRCVLSCWDDLLRIRGPLRAQSVAFGAVVFYCLFASAYTKKELLANLDHVDGSSSSRFVARVRNWLQDAESGEWAR